MAILAGISVGDWDRLEVPEGYRAEVIAGELVVSPSAAPRHGEAQALLTALLVAAAPPGFVVLLDTEWQVAAQGLVAAAPRPDIVVVEAAAIANDTKLASAPVLA
ncbi:MAG TPA: Uma2 family endonuclease, partial [Acidimicrobiales bacterium]|nr:Uma2 family endonuclease [Acidimicrobiales bacterium]